MKSVFAVCATVATAQLFLRGLSKFSVRKVTDRHLTRAEWIVLQASCQPQ